MAVYDQAYRLAKEIKKSEEYCAYQEIRKKILANEKEKLMLQDFQKKQLELQAKKLTGKEISEEESKKLEELAKIMDINQHIKNYLEAEYRLSTLLNDLQKILFGELEVGMFDDEKYVKDAP
jgi:cell fate (sporulation/competence/biofilm development) regulator YlbF (YheA/YmcA/DUF963 family)